MNTNTSVFVAVIQTNKGGKEMTQSTAVQKFKFTEHVDSNIGLVKTTNTDLELKLREEIELITLVEPLFLKRMELTEPINTEAKNHNDHQIRLGRTNIHDDVWRLWKRRPITEYVYDDNPIPKNAKGILEKLQNAGLPICCSIMIWVPDVNTHQQMELPDPILVLELSNGICVGLCRWNG